MRTAMLTLGASFLLISLGCDEPRPERVPPAAAPVPPAGTDVKIDAGGRRGVDVKVDVDPAPGGPAVNVDIDRPAEPATP